MTKTNVMRLLDAAKIPYRAAEYEVDENDLNGMHAAEGIGMPPGADLQNARCEGRARRLCCVLHPGLL